MWRLCCLRLPGYSRPQLASRQNRTCFASASRGIRIPVGAHEKLLLVNACLINWRRDMADSYPPANPDPSAPRPGFESDTQPGYIPPPNYAPPSYSTPLSGYASPGYVPPPPSYAPPPPPYAPPVAMPSYAPIGVAPIGVAPIMSRTNGLAIASLILGILGLCTFFTGIPAVICGHLALRKVDQSNGLIGGRNLAVAGLVLGYLATAMLALAIWGAITGNH